MNRPISPEEVQEVVFQMGIHKSLGPDGYMTHCFQRFWGEVKDHSLSLVLSIFRTGVIPAHLNESIICLLPKCTNLESLNQFRPIVLCNVLVKVVSKILTNKLKLMMIKLTGKQQSSFIPRRSTSDNITIVQEVIHSLTKQKGKSGGFIIKVDLERSVRPHGLEFFGTCSKIYGV